MSSSQQNPTQQVTSQPILAPKIAKRKPRRSPEEIAADKAVKAVAKQEREKKKAAKEEEKKKNTEAKALKKAQVKEKKQAQLQTMATAQGLSVEGFLQLQEEKKKVKAATIAKREGGYLILESKVLQSSSEETSQYVKAVNEIGKNTSVGTLTYYFRMFLLEKGTNTWWTQPQAVDYANDRVREDGGVDWNTEGGAKKNPDGTVAVYGDAGRTLERIRREDLENCWDNQTDSKEGPFRLNPEAVLNYQGSTKSHSFSQAIKKEVLKRCAGKCELCGHKGKIEIDHISPREKGGESVLENANALCGRCNDRKCNKIPESFAREELLRIQKWMKNAGLDGQSLLKELIH
jgi:5-methylcytosine-specific restriction endonuclease McrA